MKDTACPISMKNAIKMSLISLYTNLGHKIIQGSIKIKQLEVKKNTLNPSKSQEPRMKRRRLRPIKGLGAVKNLREVQQYRVKEPYSWLTQESRSKWKEDWDMKVNETKTFTKRMIRVQRNIKDRKQAEYNRVLNKMHSNTKEYSKELINLIEQLKTRNKHLGAINYTKEILSTSKDICNAIRANMPRLSSLKEKLAKKRNAQAIINNSNE